MSPYFTVYLRIVITEIILTEFSEISQPVVKYSTTYSAKLKQMMAICEGFRINAEVQENIYAEKEPNASMK